MSPRQGRGRSTCSRCAQARIESALGMTKHYRNLGILARRPCLPYPCGERSAEGTTEPDLPKPVMYRLTARLLVVLLFAGTFVPVAMAISAPVPHACCMRKPMHDHGSGREIQAVAGRNGNCCPSVTTAHWAELGSEVDSSVHPLLACLSPDIHPIRLTNRADTLSTVRGPPLS